MHNIPLPQNKIYEIIAKVAKNHENKVFGSYTKDDIRNECWIIALKQLPEFEISKRKNTNVEGALENWLNAILSRRLANFFRDKFVVPLQIKKKDTNPAVYNQKKSLFFPATLTSAESVQDFSSLTNDEEVFHILVEELDPYSLDVMDAILSGEVVNLYYKTKLFAKIKTILKDYYERTQD
jgi:hypothetical protein